jgi:hypothetical protein
MAITYTYKARIRLSTGNHQEVRVQADSLSNAKALLEAQYGKGSIVGGPYKV